MDQLIQRFPAQLVEALEIGENAVVTPHSKEINKIFVAGMGGSGIGADFVAEFVVNELKVPYLVGKGYDIPSYIDENTLYLASSYSGNTEETLSSLAQAESTGCKIIIIASGGKLVE
ncbi:MAG TPA: SIS domain-containing protein, partial [Saprospiraceae bacterium]|nr:SIS domain-containing protein [Saprospiraceae bacterium]